MNTTNKFFATKQDYISFRKAFAAAQNDPSSKKTLQQYKGIVGDGKGGYVDSIVKYKSPGWLSSRYYLLFNLICNRPFYSGFTPKTKKSFTEAGGNPDRGIATAIDDLRFFVICAQKVLDPSKIKAPSYYKNKDADEYVARVLQEAKNSVKHFLVPLRETITINQLANLILPEMPVSGGKPYKEVIAGDTAIIHQVQPEAEVVLTTEKVNGPKKGFFAKIGETIGISNS
jgi:hypothetical protein